MTEPSTTMVSTTAAGSCPPTGSPGAGSGSSPTVPVRQPPSHPTGTMVGVSVARNRLNPGVRVALDNAAANALIEGVEIPAELTALAAAYAAGDIDTAAFEARARAFTARLLERSSASAGARRLDPIRGIE